MHSYYILRKIKNNINLQCRPKMIAFRENRIKSVKKIKKSGFQLSFDCAQDWSVE